MAIFEDHKEYFRVKELLGNSTYWIGARHRPNNDKWTWLNGKLINQSHWAEKQPDGHGKLRCILMMNGFFHDAECSENKAYLCEYKDKLKCWMES